MDDQADFLADDILGLSDAGETDLETSATPSPACHRRDARRRLASIQARQTLTDVIKDPPAPGESLHVISASQWDFWTWIPALLAWIGQTADLYCSTWTMSRPNAVDLFAQCPHRDVLQTP
jgi:hypothetical protein